MTVRLHISMQLSSIGTHPVLHAYCVSGLSDFFAALCLTPLISGQKMPRHAGPWLSALCLLPSATLVAASRVLGQCFVQVMLKFSMLFGAFAVDMLLEKKMPERSHVLGMGIVLSGVVAIAFGGTTPTETPGIGEVVMGISAALASGIGYVLSARFTVPSKGEDANCIAFVSFLAIASMEMIALVISFSEGTGFRMNGTDALLWIFVISQGLLYTRSFQVLPTQIGYTATFTLCLSAQLLTAALFDHTRALSSQIVGLTLVFSGAALSELWRG